jgi:hypothetical protein
MKPILRWLLVPVVVLTLAQAGMADGPDETYDLSWWTIDGGGGQVTGGPYDLTGSIGQGDAEVLTGGGYFLTGGFWGGPARQPILRMPMILQR